MSNLMIDANVTRLAILVGIVLGIIIYQRTGLTTGGIVVPGYLALFMREPGHIAVTLGLASMTYIIVYQGLRRRYMLWGRQLFESEVVTTLLLQLVWLVVLAGLATRFGGNAQSLYGIGVLLPSLIAHDMGKQGVNKTLLVCLGLSLAVFGVITSLQLAGLGSSQPFTLGDAVDFPYGKQDTLIAICLSVVVSSIMYHNSKLGQLRAGGFISAAYIALFLGQPLDVVFIAVVTLISYGLVKLLSQHVLMFGRVTVASLLVTSLMVSWTLELGLQTSFNYTPWQGARVLAMMIAALLANDAYKQGIARTALGIGIASAVVFTILNLLKYVVVSA
ncbi:MAG: poly-gamma-glutamate biosynthesis protein PgsC/CapC [Deinococcota bacterium]